MAFHITAMLMTQLYLSFHPDDPKIAACISACLADISCWMKDHHLQQFHHPVRLINHNCSPTKTVRNLGVVIDDQLTFPDHIAKMARSCRFALFDIKNIRPFLSEHASQILDETFVLSRLDYCNVLLAGLLASSIKPLQIIWQQE